MLLPSVQLAALGARLLLLLLFLGSSALLLVAQCCGGRKRKMTGESQYEGPGESTTMHTETVDVEEGQELTRTRTRTREETEEQETGKTGTLYPLGKARSSKSPSTSDPVMMHSSLRTRPIKQFQKQHSGRMAHPAAPDYATLAALDKDDIFEQKGGRGLSAEPSEPEFTYKPPAPKRKQPPKPGMAPRGGDYATLANLDKNIFVTKGKPAGSIKAKTNEPNTEAAPPKDTYATLAALDQDVFKKQQKAKATPENKQQQQKAPPTAEMAPQGDDYGTLAGVLDKDIFATKGKPAAPAKASPEKRQRPGMAPTGATDYGTLPATNRDVFAAKKGKPPATGKMSPEKRPTKPTAAHKPAQPNYGKGKAPTPKPAAKGVKSKVNSAMGQKTKEKKAATTTTTKKPTPSKMKGGGGGRRR